MYIDENALLFLIWFAHPEIYACKMTLTSITNNTPLYLTFQEKLILCNDVFFYIFLSLLLICLSIVLLCVLPPSNFAILLYFSYPDWDLLNYSFYFLLYVVPLLFSSSWFHLLIICTLCCPFLWIVHLLLPFGIL